MPSLRAVGLSKHYGKLIALDSVDLTVEAGEVVGVVGPNGAGKSTLLCAVAGLVEPDGGRVEIAGVDRAARRSHRGARIGFAPQALGVYPTATVAQNLAFFGRLAGLRREDARIRAAASASRLGLGTALNRQVGILSWGQQRRVHVAAALLHEPPLVLLDEPTSGADMDTRAVLLGLVRELAGRGCAVCYATHQLADVEDLDGSVVLLNRGRVVARGTVRSVIAQHAQAAVALSFSGPAPQVGPDLEGFAVTVDGSRMVLRADDPAAALAAIVRAAPGDVVRLLTIDVLHPGLEAAYVGLTGEPYPRAIPSSEVTGVAP